MITGGAGFIGSHLSDYLLRNGHNVIIVDDLSTGNKKNINPLAQFYEFNINDDQVKQIFQKENPDYIYHYAAQVNVGRSQEEPLFDANSNIIGTIKVLNYAVKYKVKKLIFASSAAIYGNPLYLPLNEKHPTSPISFYGLSKSVAERYIKLFGHSFGLKYTILRFANVYGSRQQVAADGGVIAQFVSRYIKGESPIIYGDGEQTRDFINVDDVVEASYRALYLGDNEVLNVSTGEAVSINKLCQVLEGISGRKLLPNFGSLQKNDIKHSILDNRLAQRKLLWAPQVALKEGIEKAFYYAKNN
ncbi:MAG: NAD-dependent epimerase/dehydratase family protein [Syntrophomonadaceae bacterium]